ncbi:MAG: hypothetical protein QM808_08895 [Steroidobacteraceae bacterium]
MALDRTTLTMAELAGDGWQAQQIRLSLQLGQSSSPKVQISIAEAKLTGIAQPLRNLLIDCPQVELLAERFACPQARISGDFPYLGRQQLKGTASYARSTGAIQLSLNDLRVAKGSAQLQAQLQDANWRGQLATQDIDLAELLKLAKQVSEEFPMPIDRQNLPDVTGSMAFTIQAQGVGTAPDTLAWQSNTHELTLGNAAGTLATDKLKFNTKGSATRATKSGNWQFDVRVDSDQGQAYYEPIFVDLGQHVLQLSAQGNWNGVDAIQLQQLQLEQTDIVSATANGNLQLNPDNPAPALQLQIARLKFPGTFATYLQPFLLDSGFKNLTTAGDVQGAIQIENSLPSRVDLQLQQLRADDGNNLRLEQVDGEIHWRKSVAEDTDPPRSTLSWQSGSLLGLELGATQLQLELWDTNARIAEPTRIPIFNGALAVDAFRVRKAGTPQMAFMLDAAIEPISVAQISKAFGWPEFGGELSGNITKLRMEEGVLTLGATLTAQVFAGSAAISDMRLEGALTQWPRFSADIGFKNLDLEQVTQAFSFGRITGRLSGEINDLELFNWEPTSFDAHLYTPSDDRSRHRISQRAVQNIGSVGGSGGGVATALQSGFLKFFDDFNYDRLGLSCKLVNNVCLMNGVTPAANGGYYLVKGKGLPRIDVIGNATRVDWPRLVAQLKAVTESEGPVVR